MKKCLYCNKELDQHDSHEECLNCKFPVKGSADDAIKVISKKTNMAFFYIGLVSLGYMFGVVMELVQIDMIVIWVLVGVFIAIFYYRFEKIARFTILKSKKVR